MGATRDGSAWHTRVMQSSSALARTLRHSTGRFRRSLSAAAEASAPRGRVFRLQVRVTVDLIVTLVMVALAVISATAYQVIRWRSGRDTRP